MGSRTAAFIALAAIRVGSTIWLISCSDGTEPESPPAETVARYMGTLPAWAVHFPLAEETAEPVAMGWPQRAVDTVDVEVIAEDGSIAVQDGVGYSRAATEYSLTKNPEKTGMFGGPNRDILWPGALVQGASHSEGLGSLLPLTIAPRPPLAR